MKLKKLEIRRREAYEAQGANSLCGLVTLQGETGQQDITLSPGAISRIIAALSEEVVKQARCNAAMTSTALTEARDELLLAESDGTIALPDVL